MAGRYIGHKCIGRDRQFKEDNKYLQLESESFYSSFAGQESSSYDETLDDFGRDNYNMHDKIHILKYVKRNKGKVQCLLKKVSERELRVQHVIADYDEVLRSERAKNRQLRCKISTLSSELECLNKNVKSTTSTNILLKKQLVDKENEKDSLKDQLNEANIDLAKLNSDLGCQKKQKQNLEKLISMLDIDINVKQFIISQSKTRSRTVHEQTELQVENNDQSCAKIVQPKKDMVHLKEKEIGLRKTEIKRNSSIRVKTELKEKTDENRLRALAKEIEKPLQHRELQNYDAGPTDVKKRHERRGKEKDAKEREEQLNEKNSHEEKCLTDLNENNNIINRQSRHDKNKQKNGFILQEGVEKKSIDNVDIKELRSEHNDLKQNINEREFEININQRDLELKAVEEQTKAEKSTVKEKGNISIQHDDNEQEFGSREVDVHEKQSILTDEQKNIIYLKEQIDKRDQMLKESLESTQNKLKSEEHLNDLIKEMEANLSEQQTQLKRALSTLKENETVLDDMKNERDFERKMRLDLEKKSRKNNDKIKTLTSENNDFRQRLQSLEIDIKQRDIKLKAFKEKSKAGVDTEKEKDKILSEKDNQITKLEDQIQQLLAVLKETEAELEETKIRLSKVMGDRLKDNNPNIADLSDENRPVKLAERYSELYDNQWTDAFDFLSKSIDSEQNTIEALLEMLQDIMYFCITSASKQLEDLQGMLVFSNTSVGDIPVDVRLHLKNFRKALSKTAIRNLYENYISHLKQTAPDSFRSAQEVRPYVQECLEICWLMSIQDPPVVFAPVAKQGSVLDTNIYKHYTSSGTHVEYTVWPAMLLYEKGPLLSKGVAQGR